LKVFEGFLGNSIKETSVPFNINRKLTESEIQETIQYCRHDVEQTIEVFFKRKEEFDAHMGLVELAGDISLVSKTNPQLAAIILDAKPRTYNDEFDIDFPHTMRIEKYTTVPEWYKKPENRNYDAKFEIEVAGVPHQFGYGGIHGALTQYHGEGFFVNMDVASLYPSLMINYSLGSRSMANPAKYEEIYHQRLKYKKEGNPLHEPLKIVLNSVYGVMREPSNALYDPRQANRVCVYGQLLLLDLIERLEPHCQIIQSNTDGVLIKLHRPEDYDLIDDICYEWESRTNLKLEFEEFRIVYQKDVNNYVIIDENGEYKSKGAYVKKLSPLDYDLPIVNKALVNFMVRGVPLETTILECDDLKEFQLVAKISNKYTLIMHGNEPLKERCVRVFASKDPSDKGVKKVHAETNKLAKIANSPDNCFIWNGKVNNVKVPEKLNKNFYLSMAKKRLADFGCEQLRMKSLFPF
jgi:DNA polymerase